MYLCFGLNVNYLYIQQCLVDAITDAAMWEVVLGMAPNLPNTGFCRLPHIRCFITKMRELGFMDDVEHTDEFNNGSI